MSHDGYRLGASRFTKRGGRGASRDTSLILVTIKGEEATHLNECGSSRTSEVEVVGNH